MEDSIKAIKIYVREINRTIELKEKGEASSLDVLSDAHAYSEWILKEVAEHTEFKTPDEIVRA